MLIIWTDKKLNQKELFLLKRLTYNLHIIILELLDIAPLEFVQREGQDEASGVNKMGEAITQ